MDSKVSMNTLMHLNCFEENLVKWHTSEKFWILCQSDLNILHKVLSPTMNEISISKERGSEFQRFIDSAEAISYKVRLERGTQLTYTCLSKWLFVYKY